MITNFLPTFLPKATCPPLDLHIEALIAEPTSKLKAGQVKHLGFDTICLSRRHILPLASENISCVFLKLSNFPKPTSKLKAGQINRFGLLPLLWKVRLVSYFEIIHLFKIIHVFQNYQKIYLRRKRIKKISLLWTCFPWKGQVQLCLWWLCRYWEEQLSFVITFLCCDYCILWSIHRT